MSDPVWRTYMTSEYMGASYWVVTKDHQQVAKIYTDGKDGQLRAFMSKGTARNDGEYIGLFADLPAAVAGIKETNGWMS